MALLMCCKIKCFIKIITKLKIIVSLLVSTKVLVIRFVDENVDY